ncbi:hypothetical protein [Flavobacterium cellulosilyticum]|uniref:Uncharacterized protein n=1 Tax=Flavobacterium cellulosilyticum TaxID=2541731 RepID=A0A4R5CDN1_9FLAO|nr:hypothetical protein [Flavobacterium cellulosilyticum]TDD97039.1 hypothetical protein E0F76_10400 [Flavobacterium cellulosilyticum]
MSSRKVRKKRKLGYVFACFFIFGLGFYILDEISTWYEVPLGSTFYVILGCTLMASSGVYIIYSIKKIYFTKGKKRSKQLFLKKEENKLDKK